MSYVVSYIPLSFLGIQIVCNPRRLSSWLLVLAKVQNKLVSRKGKNLSLGGRVTLLNSVLNAIPLFTFSFYKAPNFFIQCAFLWNGKENTRRINWVPWSPICLQKPNGGLGLKDYDLFNRTLLCK